MKSSAVKSTQSVGSQPVGVPANIARQLSHGNTEPFYNGLGPVPRLHPGLGLGPGLGPDLGPALGPGPSLGPGLGQGSGIGLDLDLGLRLGPGLDD